MRFHNKTLALALLGVAALQSTASAAADDDALALQAAPDAATATATDRPWRFFAEAAAGRTAQRYGLADQDTRRLSLDFSLTARPAPGWRLVLSDRLDDVHPVDSGSRSTLNSLREAYVGWQDEAGSLLVDGGRVNLRNGPGYGFNPTDFLRDGSLRLMTTADPLALRENRLGVAMLRVQRNWADGALSLAVAPELDDERSDRSFGADFGSTNRRAKALLTLSGKPAEGLNGQLLVYGEEGRGLQWGASATALWSDSTVGHIEWAYGRDRPLLADLDPAGGDRRWRHRLATGATYTTSTRLSLTAEFEYNGFAASRDELDAAGLLNADGLGGYVLAAQRRQDSASRRALLFYAMQRGGVWKKLDLTGLLRVNLDDHSRFAWVEARYHWSSFDLALQWQASLGRALSEYGVVPNRRSVQLLAAYYF